MTGFRILTTATVCAAVAGVACAPDDDMSQRPPTQQSAEWEAVVHAQGGLSFFERDTVNLWCWLVDSTGQQLGVPPDTVWWVSDQAGALGSGPALATWALPVGTHRIWAMALYGGILDTAAIVLRIVPWDSVHVWVAAVAAEGSICWQDGVARRYAEASGPLRVIAAGDAFYLWESQSWPSLPQIRYWRDTAKVVLAAEWGHVISLCVQRNGLVCALVRLDTVRTDGRHSPFVLYRGSDTLLPPDTPFVPCAVGCQGDSVAVWGRVLVPGVFAGFCCWSTHGMCDSVPLPESMLPENVRAVEMVDAGQSLICDVATVYDDMLIAHGWFWRDGRGIPIAPDPTAASPRTWIRVKDCGFWNGTAHVIGMVIGYPTYYYYWKDSGSRLLYTSDTVGPIRQPNAVVALNNRVFFAGAVRDSVGASRPCYWRDDGACFDLEPSGHTDITITGIAIAER